eukprot:TRINITY_DN6541_c0_g1_i1.p1 TRINITY_DN6541_c0_g1~~TRINITY_DN6541_c0_g1_i1.p1  ORF type:complete len:262 (-),score=84.93 TRINITY_DN6541_c0_g1_i1:281-1066(-)
MAKSRFEYVKKFEADDSVLRETYLVVRIDGCSFSKFVTDHGFEKPNDKRGLDLMNACAMRVFTSYPDCVFAIGSSDEYSFVLPPSCRLFRRRKAKIESAFVSLFASSFVFEWAQHFPEQPLLYPPAFDARIVAYPRRSILRDYLSWRQADFHINNLYNTAFWALVQRGELTPADAEAELCGTTSDVKHEIMFSRFAINYNKEPAQYRKGSIIFRQFVEEVKVDSRNGQEVTRQRKRLVVAHDDVIGEEFWRRHPHLLPELS